MKKNISLFLALFLSFGLFSQETAITSVMLVNADTNADIVEISAGMVINLQEYPGVAFSIRAIAVGNVKSVRLQLDGPVSGAMTENVAPYALFGDVSGNFNGKTFLPGAYMMQATPYNAPNLGGVAGEELVINFSIIDEDVQRPFITTWKTDNPGDSPDNQITIPTFPGEIYDYSVDWGDGFINENVTGEITHGYASAGTYTVSISGDFPRIYFNNDGDKDKLLLIEQWGDLEWTSMLGAFRGCTNLDVIATDAPNLNQVNSISYMFGNCENLIGNGSFNDWDVSSVTDMSWLLNEALVFNQDIGDWNVSNVTTMQGMFNGAQAFNQDIGGWNVSNVTNMASMFLVDLAFDQDLTNWNTSKVTNMSQMFAAAISFNQNINSWDTSSVISMGGMFEMASDFNQDLGNWNTGNVTNMSGMFNHSYSFDQDISTWNVTQVSTMDDMFGQTSISSENYDALLNSWSNQELENGVTFGGGNSQFCQGEEARQKLIDEFGWTITDGGKSADCPDTTSFITTWKTDNPGLSADNQITITTDPERTYNYTIEWGDGSSDSGVTGEITHSYATPGTYEVSISGNFPRFCFKCDESGISDTKDRRKLILVNQWGDIEWETMERAFEICTNLDVVAQDVPDLSGVLSMRRMFGAASALNGNLKFNDWDVSSVTDFSNMFSGTSNFNQPLDKWNMANAVNLSSMFSESGFNQNIEDWDVSSVTNMSTMFSRSAFNQELDSWNVGAVTAMQNMFSHTEFNKDISAWNVSSVEFMFNMFLDSQFNQDISNWDVSSVTMMSSMFENGNLSDENYDNLLLGWAQLESLQNAVRLDAPQNKFCLGEAARQKLIDDFGWTISDGGKAEDCIDTTSFITTWKTDNPGTSEDNQISIPTFPEEVYNYSVDWGDGTSNSAVTGEITHTYEAPGTYQVSISGNFPRIYFNNEGDKNKLLKVEQWGDIRWTSMGSAFYGCENMDVSATDVPDFSNLTSLSYMFAQCSLLKGNETFNQWNTSAIIDMSEMFHATVIFNQDIGGWNVGNVENMSGMLSSTTDFNQDISNWDVGKVKNMSAMFIGARSFNAPIGNWDVSNVIYMGAMFFSAETFNQDISNWDVSNTTVFSSMFYAASSFNQNLASWNVENAEYLNNMFSFSGLSDLNYDNLLLGWVQLPLLQNNVQLDAPQNRYCLGEAARQKLIDDFGWIINDEGRAEACDTSVEGEADLLAATYLQGARNPEPTGPIMRVEEGNRETYLKFDLSDFTGDITEARLEMVVSSDPGHGTLEVFLGSNTNWTETGLNGSNKPSIVGGALASISGTHSLGQTKLWNLDVSQLSGGGEITLIVKHSNGNDVAFASDETANAPSLMIMAGPTVPVDADGDGSFSDVDCNDDDDTIFPGAPELCDGKDNDCDGAIDEDLPTSSFYVDFDGDGFGDPLTETQLCDIQAGYVLDNTDCDDNNAAVNPDALEVCDGIDNNCDGLIDDEDPNVTCDTPIEGEADLIDATYLQGSGNPEPTGPILRIEEGNRETYMKFDLSGFPGDITEAQLEMVVSSDPGNGTLEVFLGSDSNWTETGLNGSNKPSIVGSTLASISGTHSLGQTKTWNLDVSQIPSGGLITLIVKHSNGNDVAFASDETANAPKLMISSGGAVTNSTNSLNLSPNPASDEIVVGFEIPIQVGAVFVYDVSGKLVQATPPGTAKSQGDFPMDVSGLPDGMYFLRTFDADGIPHQKTMVIDH